MYLASFRLVAASAAEAAIEEEMRKYEGATVSVTVTSQMAHRPPRQGIRVRPSGRLPSCLFRPCMRFFDGWKPSFL